MPIRKPEMIVDPVVHIPCLHCDWLIHTGEMHDCESCGVVHTPDVTWEEHESITSRADGPAAPKGYGRLEDVPS